jgi:hypothetical protein
MACCFSIIVPQDEAVGEAHARTPKTPQTGMRPTPPYKSSHLPIDAEHAAKFAQYLEKVGQLKTLFEFHNPSMS